MIGVIGGFLIFDRKSSGNLNRVVVNVFWLMSLGFITSHVFFKLKPVDSRVGRLLYDSVYRELWSCAIAWIVYACHHLKSGAILRCFFSHRLWQPLSKTCLSVYLTHFVYLTLTHYNQKEIQWVNLWWQVHIHIADIVISFFIGFLFFLIVEAPTTNILKHLWRSKPADSLSTGEIFSFVAK